MKRGLPLGPLSLGLVALEGVMVAALLGAFSTSVATPLLVGALAATLLVHHLLVLAGAGRARRAARESEQVRNTFLVRMSHAIRTPMNAILGTADVLLESRLPREQQESAEVIKSAAEALLATLTNALEFAKGRAGRIELEVAPFEVARVLHDAVRSQSARARRKGIELCWEVSADVPDRLRGDRRRLQQVLHNLVENAVRHTTEGEVVVRTRLESLTDSHAVVAFEVADTGSGLAPERLAQILAERDRATTVDAGDAGDEGVGLGLPVAAALVERMAGRLSAAARPDGGSILRFAVRLALEGGAPAWVAPVAAPELREKSVLVVDDNQTSREILVAALRAWRAAPLPAPSGSEALRILKEAYDAGRPPIVALIDLQMPGMPGLILAELLKGDPRYRSLPLIALSQGADAEEAERCRHQGFSAYLAKPALPSDLLEAARRASAAAATPEPPTAPSPAERRRTPRLRVLVADDNRVDRTLVVRLLEKRGHDVTAVASGEEAVQTCAADAFDLVLMDVQMPHVSGLDATSAIRTRERRVGGHLPIIALTADDDSARCLAAGMDAYLAKPVNPHEMVEAIARLTAADEGAALDASLDAPAARGSLDESAALEQAGGDRSLLVDLAQMCLADAPVALERIRQAIAAEDPEAARRIAQKLRGSLLVLAAAPAARAAQRFDEIAAEGSLDRAGAALAALERTIERLQPALAELVQATR